MKPEIAQKAEHLAGLDGLRALAALSVFGVHFNQITQLDYEIGPVSVYRLLANGNHAVSLFFSLSGFLLSLPFWKAIALERPLPSTRRYLLRRLARILPAYYLALTILIVLGSLWRVPEAKVDILLHYTFLFNYTEFSIFSINPPFWTLAVEAQFYVLLPGLLLLARRISRRSPLLTIVVVAVVAYAMHYGLIRSVSRIVPWPYSPWLTWIRPHGAVLSHSVLANLPHFLIGVAMGRLSLRVSQSDVGNRKRRCVCEIAFWIALPGTLVLLATGWHERLTLPYSPYGLPVVPLLLAILIFTTPFTQFGRRVLGGCLMRKLGAVSYGFYIYHVPCLNYLDHAMTRLGLDAVEHWPLLGGVALILTILIASISYHVVEKPCLEYIRSRQKAVQPRFPNDRGRVHSKSP